MNRFLPMACALMALLLAAVSPRVDADESASAPYFSVNDGKTIERLPLLQTNADVNVAGPIAEVVLKQTFENRGAATIEATYVFPASDRGAVSALTMRIGSRIVQAEIQERSEAKRTYEAARDTGHTAALLEQHDAGTFTMNLANILPGDRIDVELHYTELLVPTDGYYQFELPNTFGVEHYLRTGESSPNRPTSTDPQVTDYSFAVNVHVHAGVPIASMESPSHHVLIEAPTAMERVVRLADDEIKASTRDFVLRYSLAGGEIGNGLLLYPGKDENFFLLMMQPPRAPAPAAISAREYIFVVDVSGSMRGPPMEAAKAMMHSLLATLKPQDRFNVILFAGRFDILDKRQSLPVGSDTIGRAMALIDEVKASGGTELLPALEAAYALPRPSGMSRSIVVVTDGGIAAGGDAARLIRSHLDEANLFAFGTGPGADRPVMRRLARAGLGEPFFAEDAKAGAAETQRFRSYVEQPLLTDIHVDFNGFTPYDVFPEKLPDLFAQRPLVLIGKYKGPAAGQIRITGKGGDAPYVGTLEMATAASGDFNAPLRTLWAREHIADRLDAGDSSDQESSAAHDLVKMSLDYSVLTPLTAFIAVSAEQRSDGASPVKVDQPVAARASMNSYSGGGGDALQASVRLFGGAALANVAHSSAADVREVAGKQFRELDGVWTDTTWDPTSVTLRIRRGSPAYVALLALRPELASWSSLGSTVLVRVGRYSIRVGDDGFSNFPVQTLSRAARG
ncbi:MAG: VIT domain-containing protein [Dokdonella sp.]